MLIVPMLVLAQAVAPAHPRLSPDAMFALQFPYRYHVQIAQVVWHPVVGRFELEVTELYANRIVIGHMASRGTDGLVTKVDLQLADGVRFPDDRYEHFDLSLIDWEGTYLVTISDRQEHRPLWPPTPDP